MAIFLSAIFPAYNESLRIVPTLEQALSYFQQAGYAFEIIIVDDGSTDGTAELCRASFGNEPRLRIIELDRNFGKGYAVRAGIEAARGEYILFADADNSTPIAELDKFFHKMAPDVVLIGSRFLQPGLVERKQPWHRVAISRLANWVIRLLIIKKVRDTQCGFKVFHKRAAALFLEFQHIHRYGFDIEYLTIARQNGFAITEIPVRWINSPVSRIRPVRDTLGTLRDLLQILYNRWRNEYRA